MDDENRRAKELWVACRSFKERVVEGRDGRTAEQRRKPLANDVCSMPVFSFMDIKLTP